MAIVNGTHYEDLGEARDALEQQIETVSELTLNAGSVWLDYIDLGLKALLVIAAFAIAARI